jgi:hypothetical protein
MSFRIDPLGPGASARLLRVKPIPSRHEEQRRKRRKQEEPGASYAPGPEPLADAYGPRASGARAEVTGASSGDATPTWVAALLRAR